jgi:hypothetical protein
MDAVRIPHWLSKADRTDLAAAISTALSAGDLHPVQECHLRDIQVELGVATARDRVWPDKAAIVRRAVGYSDDVLPIRVSEDEVNAALALTHLSPSARAALNDGKSTP